jgi:uncharacterized protein (TIGR02270 family)
LQTNTARLRYIPDLLTTHLEELEFLWGQRRLAMHSPRYFLRDFLHLNERLEAHIQGLLSVPSALPDLLLPQLLAAESRDSVFAAACPLLRLANVELTAQVVDRFQHADAKSAPGFRDAFSFAPVGQFVNTLKRILQEGEPLHAAYTATALANQRVFDHSHHSALNALLLNENDLIATTAWYASIAIDCLPSAPQLTRPYQQALLRPEANIRDVALKSAIWTRQAWIAPVLRQLASSGDKVALKWLAIIATGGEDGALIVAQSKLLENPQSCCDIAVRFGHPGVLEVLRGWVANGDSLLASLSGEAFTRVTACDVRGERIQAPVSDSADEFDREFAPLIWTTDISKINNYLRQNSNLLKSANRWSRGLSLDGAVPLETLAAIDLQMRWDQLARNRLAGNLSYQPDPIVY